VIRNLLLALPPLAVTAALAIVACSEAAGAHALTMGEPRSVSEAIALRDAAGAARLVESGADVNAVGLIRSGILSDQPILATPLETAVIVDGAAVLDYLVSRGAASADENLTCLAADVSAKAVRTRVGDASRCRKGAALQAVLARP